MTNSFDLEQLRLRLSRLEREMEETRRMLAALEREAKAMRTEAGDTRAGTASTDVVIKPEDVGAVELVVPPPLPVLQGGVGSGVDREEVANEVRTGVADGAVAAFSSEASPSLPPRREEVLLIEWLRRMQLWPPAEAGTDSGAESRLGAWWATRIGAFLAVVGMVFFGVYVSANASPWVRFFELVAVSVSVVWGGRWLERRIETFGRVVLGAGLALGFFTAYAGHAVPAVRVMPGLGTSLIAQAAVVGMMVVMAIRRGASGLASFAIGMGFVTAFLASQGGRVEAGLAAGALLTATALGLAWRRGWDGPSAVAMPAAHALAGFGAIGAWWVGAAPAEMARWIFLVGAATVFALKPYARDALGAVRSSVGERVFFGVNGTLALAVGFVMALAWHAAELEWFYLGAAVWCVGVAWWHVRAAGKGDAIGGWFMAKGAGALALAVMELVAVRTVPVALLVQAGVLVWGARRTGSRVLGWSAAAVTLFAVAIFYKNDPVGTSVGSVETLRTVLFGLGVAALAAELRQHAAGVSVPVRGLVTGTVVLAVGAGLIAAAAKWTPQAWAPTYALGLALLFGGVAWWRRGRSARWLAAIFLGVAQVWLWMASADYAGGEPLWANALFVVGAAVAAGAWARQSWRAIAAWSLAMVSVVAVLFALLEAPVALALAVALGVGLSAVAGGVVERGLVWIGSGASMLGFGLWVFGGASGGDYAVALLAAGALIWVQVWLAARVRPEAAWWGAVLGLPLNLAVAWAALAGPDRAWAILGLAGLAAAAARPGGAQAGWLGAWFLATVLLVECGLRALIGEAEWGGTGWFGVATATALTVGGSPLLLAKARDGWATAARWCAGLAGLGLWFTVTASQGKEVGAYATVAWALGSIACFMAGLFRRIAVYRAVGLLGLALCLPRLLVVDLTSTLQRIVTFIALGLVLLWVGFSYERFRYLLSDTSASNSEPR